MVTQQKCWVFSFPFLSAVWIFGVLFVKAEKGRGLVKMCKCFWCWLCSVWGEMSVTCSYVWLAAVSLQTRGRMGNLETRAVSTESPCCLCSVVGGENWALLETNTDQELNLCINQRNHIFSWWEKPFQESWNMCFCIEHLSLYFSLFQLFIAKNLIHYGYRHHYL